MNITIQHYIIGMIFTYIPIHLFEEARGNFPKWMYEHKYMKETLTYGFWLAGNVFFFFPLLIIGAMIYEFCGRTFLFSGIAVLLWGGVNFCEHLFFTIKDKKVCPGLYSSILFAAIAGLGIKKATELNANVFDFLLSIPVVILFMVLPIIMQMYVGPKLWNGLID